MVHPRVLSRVGLRHRALHRLRLRDGGRRIAMLSAASTTSGCSSRATTASSDSSRIKRLYHARSLHRLQDYADLEGTAEQAAEMLAQVGVPVE